MGEPAELRCPTCDRRFSPAAPHNLCVCGSPLLVDYDLAAVGRALRPSDLRDREPSMWRYWELLPVIRREHLVTLGEGWTPVLPLARLGERLGLPRLFMKDEGLNPTGTFKARGAAAGVSKAKELGIRAVAMPTAGNAGGAWAAYGARAGLEVVVAMPADTPEVNQREALAYGARVVLVDGLISDAGRLIAEAAARSGWFDVATLREPYRIEGKKTLGLEIAEQFAWDPPEVILYPAGGGVGLIGMWRAFDQLAALGWIGERRPRLVAVQAEGCAPLVQAFHAGAATAPFWEGAQTVASGLRVPKALGDFLVLRALRETDGYAIAVSDAALVQAMHELAALEGLWICPEGAATVAALPLLRDLGVVRPEDRVLVLNTGSGLKYPHLVHGEYEVRQVGSPW
ncbi:MAG: threonine synthase [Chloroflexi bacterium]|nr:threonine synthase [Chloroflexota bacterium]